MLNALSFYSQVIFACCYEAYNGLQKGAQCTTNEAEMLYSQAQRVCGLDMSELIEW